MCRFSLSCSSMCAALRTLKVKVRHGKLSKGLEAIAANCRMIETLSLPTQVRESSLGPLLSSFPHLTRLDLSWSTKLADPAFATIASSCSRLTHLDASFSQISHTGLASLAAHCPALSSLRLNACHAIRPPLCLPVLARLPSLQSLDLGQSPLLPDWIEGIISLQAGVQDGVCGGKERSGGKDRCGGKEGPGAAAGTTPLAGFPHSGSAPAVASTACTPAAAAGAASSCHLLPSLRTLTAYFQANQTIRATWIESWRPVYCAADPLELRAVRRLFCLALPTPALSSPPARFPLPSPYPCSLTLACPTLRRINFGTTSRILLSPTPSTTTTTQLTTSSSSSAVNALPGPPTSTPSPSAHRRILTPRSPGIFSRLAALASPRTKPLEGPPRAGGGPSSAGVGCAGGSAAARNGAGSGGASDAAASLVSAAAPAPVAAAAAAPRDTDTASPAPLPATPPPTAPTALSSATATTASAHTPPRTPNHAPPLESLVLPCFGMSDTVISAIASACPCLTSLRFDPGSKKRYAKILGMFQVAGALDTLRSNHWPPAVRHSQSSTSFQTTFSAPVSPPTPPLHLLPLPHYPLFLITIRHPPLLFPIVVRPPPPPYPLYAITIPPHPPPRRPPPHPPLLFPPSLPTASSPSRSSLSPALLSLTRELPA
ncbi:unnamed protein product [Closterium sp. NIES-54]